MTCQELVELVTDYLEGIVSDDEVARLERHLCDCPGCRAYIEQMREAIGLLASMSSGTLSRDQAEAVIAALRRRNEDDP